jgi:peptide deformylase
MNTSNDMMNIKIITDKEELKKPCELVASVLEAKQIAEKLEVCLSLFDGAGLSANQIGIRKRMSILKDARKGFIFLINPKVIEKKNEFTFEGEGCLSFPLRFWKTKRYSEFTIKNNVIDGDNFREENQYFYCEPENVNNKDKMTMEDLQGVCSQHEMDHQMGLIISDYGIEQVSGQVINKKEKVGRNDKCPCGSGIKYKNCCLRLAIKC